MWWSGVSQNRPITTFLSGDRVGAVTGTNILTNPSSNQPHHTDEKIV